jgi:BsuBI/PstI restriction endonuclease HTH domain/BsuBI/PstI restriction endonuclease domain
MLPLLPDVPEVQARLQAIFPEGSPRRNYCVREIAARTVFVMLYVGAVEGSSVWIGPKHVYRMSAARSADWSKAARLGYLAEINRRRGTRAADAWYEDTTREPIRDETLKDGLVQAGAVVTKPGVPTTSSKPRYALQAAFAGLFDPALAGEALGTAIRAWQERYLSAGALARVRLRGRAAAAAGSKVRVELPNGEARQMEAGPSSVITKAVVEVFARRFLAEPAVLWISESGTRVVQHDDALARELGLRIEAGRLLPDLILVDLAPADPLLVFVEVVATDGPVTSARREALLELLVAAGETMQTGGGLTRSE